MKQPQQFSCLTLKPNFPLADGDFLFKFGFLCPIKNYEPAPILKPIESAL